MSTADTNLSDTERPVADVPPAAGAIGMERTMTTLGVLIRREFWEHRALWMAPLVTSAVLIVCAFPAHFDLPDITRANSASGAHSIAFVAGIQWGLTVAEFLVVGIVLNFYLLDCLYAERKDRSILFWKSLPASDGATVASKLLVSQAIVPLGVFLLSAITNLLFSLVWMGRAALGYLPAAAAAWDTMSWLKVEAAILMTVIISALWYAPLAAYLLLVSAWARRSVFLWATLPPVLAIVAERFAFGTGYVWNLIAYRSGGIYPYVHMQQIIEQTVAPGAHGRHLSFIDISLDLASAFGNIDMWIGLAVTAALAFAAARIRRYRDDT